MEQSNIPMRDSKYGTDMEMREFSPVGDLNGSLVVLWQGPKGWSVTVQYRSPHWGYERAPRIPLRRNATEEEAREVYRVTIEERNGSYKHEATRLGL